MAGLSQKYFQCVGIDDDKPLGRERMNPREKVNF